MKLETLLVMLLIFVFTAFLFPTLYDACRTVNQTLTTAPIIEVFPWIFLMAVIAVTSYLGFKERG